jgi:hypothetical protein
VAGATLSFVALLVTFGTLNRLRAARRDRDEILEG